MRTKTDVRTRLTVAASPFPADEQLTPDRLTLTLSNVHRHFDNNSGVVDQQIVVDRNTWTFILWLLNSVDKGLGTMKLDADASEMMDDDTMVFTYIIE